MARRKRIITNVTAIDIADKGQCMGKTEEGEIVIIQGDCVPGDVVDFLYLKKKKGLKLGRVARQITASIHRREAFCEHFDHCGGCKWQNFDYNQQAKHKENIVRQAIKRLANDDDNKVCQILAADKQREYRNKLEYSFSAKRWLTVEEIQSGKVIGDRKGLGFHVAGAFDKVLHIDKCHLQEDLSNQVRNTIHRLAEEYEWSYYDHYRHEGFLRHVVIKSSRQGDWLVNIVFGEDDIEKRKLLFTHLIESFPDVKSWSFMISKKMNSSTFDLDVHQVHGTDHIVERIDSINYRISAKSFFQTNPYQAEKLYRQALEMAQLTGNEVVYDLYTGTGSIALYVAQRAKKVIGIEIVPEAIHDANINAQNNGITNCEFLVGDVKDTLTPAFRESYEAPDVIITDPPRAGMHQNVIDTILKLLPEKLVYISCNPATQARDILLLKEQYDLTRVVPVDMFPHTSHIESVALLIKK